MKYHFFRGKRMKFLHRIQQGILAVCLGVLLGGSFAESQAAALQIGEAAYTLRQQNRKWRWKSTNNQPLTAQKLKEHLETRGIGKNSFKELGRLILAQDLHDHDNPSNSGPNYINRQRAGGLCKTRTLLDLTDHLFDHGHMGYYPHAKAINRRDSYVVVYIDPSIKRRGIFNIGSTIRERILPEIQSWFQKRALSATGNIILRGGPLGEVKGYDVDLPPDEMVSLEEAAINLITCLFSSNTFDDIQIGLVSDERFNIYATYNGGPIQGIDYTHPTVLPLPPTNCLGLQSNGIPTNRICLVVGVYSGRIYIASLFPEG